MAVEYEYLIWKVKDQLFDVMVLRRIYSHWLCFFGTKRRTPLPRLRLRLTPITWLSRYVYEEQRR